MTLIVTPIASTPPDPKPKAPKPKNDPRMIAAARELRDRWLEKVNSGEYTPELTAKYDVRRAIADTSTMPTIAAPPLPLLEAA